MKLLCTILAFMVLFLSLQGVCVTANAAEAAVCCAADDCSGEEEQNSEEHKGCASCNPFQICSCCACCVVLPAQVVPALNTVFTGTPQLQWSDLTQPQPDEPLYGFWQPPRA